MCRLLTLLTSYHWLLDLALLEPHCAAAQTMREMCAVDRRGEPLQGIDVSWCEQHVPALERLLSSLLDTEPMLQARNQWLQHFDTISQQREAERAASERRQERYDFALDGLRGDRRAADDLLNPAHDAVTKKVVTANFESLVLDNRRDVLLGIKQPRLQPYIRDLGLCIRSLIPAAARIIRQYQQQRGISLEQAQSAPPGQRQHGESLVFGVMAAGCSMGQDSCDLDVNWIDPADYRTLLSCDGVASGGGAFLLYPAGEKPSEQHYDFYTVMRSVYRQQPQERAPWLPGDQRPRDELLFLEPFNPPSLSSLLRFVHANMKGGTFDLEAVLALAAPHEATSLLVGRLLGTRQDLMDMTGYSVRGDDLSGLNAVLFLCSSPDTTRLEALTDSAVFQSAPQELQRLDQIKARILSTVAANKERKRRAEEKKVEKSQSSKRSRSRRDESSGAQQAVLQLVRPGKQNAAAVRRVLKQMRRMPMLDAYAWHPAAARLHLYVDPSTGSTGSSSTSSEVSWSLVFEVLGWLDMDSSGSADHVGELRVYAEGSAAQDDGCASGWSEFFDDSAVQNAHYEQEQEGLEQVGEDANAHEESQDDDDDGGNVLGQRSRWVRIRDQRVPVIRDLDALAELGVIVQHPPNIHKREHLRALAAQHKDGLMSTEDELRARMRRGGQGLLKLLQLEDWYHCDGSKNESSDGEREDDSNGSDGHSRFDHFPSRNPTLQALAQCIVDRSAEHYRAVQMAGLLPAPNTHWSHWPNQGRYGEI